MALTTRILILSALLMGCAPRNLPDGLDKNNVPSHLEVGRHEEMEIPESDRPLTRNPLAEPNPTLPPEF